MTDLILSDGVGVAVGAGVAVGGTATSGKNVLVAGVVGAAAMAVGGGTGDGDGGGLVGGGVAVESAAFWPGTQLAARPAPAVSTYFRNARRESALRRLKGRMFDLVDGRQMLYQAFAQRNNRQYRGAGQGGRKRAGVANV